MNNKKRFLTSLTDMISKKMVSILALIAILLSLYQLPVMAETADNASTYANGGAVPFENETVPVYEASEEISAYSNLPERINLSTSKYFPPIRHQEGNSCTAWATTYYQFTYEVARLNNWDAKQDASKVFSPKYVWNYLNEGEDKGIGFESTYEFLKSQGSLRWTEFPQNNIGLDWYTGSNETETINALRRALKTRVVEYADHVFADIIKEPTSITGNKDAQLTIMKQLLSEGHVLCMATDCNVATVKNNKILSNGEKGIIAGERNPREGHALTIVGYDDTIYYDLNQNGSIEDFEKGAFLIANSWGTDPATHNNGYIWVMYDALNKSSNAPNLNASDRCNFIRFCQIWYINVKNYNPKRMAEVTVEQKYRSEVSVILSANDRLGNPVFHNNTFLYGIGGEKSFDGGNNGYQTRTFVFDYATIEDGEQMDWPNKICWVIVADNTSGGAANTIVKKVRWVDENGNILKTLTPQMTLDGDYALYYYGIPAKSISLNKSSSTLYKGESEQLTATVLPENATDKTVKWTSSDRKVVKVDSSGLVTYVGPGTATITATTSDGSNLSASCTYQITDDYYEAFQKAWKVTMHSKTPGSINQANDVDCFKFTPAATGEYLIATTGEGDTVGSLYNSGYTLLKEDDDSGSGYNFAMKYTLEANKTYYIKIKGYSTKMGDYALNISKDLYGASLADNNQDARRVQMQVEAATALTTLKLKIGSHTYTLNRPESGDLNITNSDGTRFKVTFKENNNGLSTIWNIEARIPATQSGTDTVSFDFSEGGLTVKSPDITGLIAYDSAIITGVEASKADSLQRLLTTMQQNGYTLTVRNFDNTLVNVTSTTKAATGMKIFRKNVNGMITNIYYVVVFGDVEGGSANPGDGSITATDSLEVQKSVVGSAELVVLAALAADTNHDGAVTAEDALLIQKNIVGSEMINQNYEIISIPDDCYYLDPVTFAD